MNREESHDQEPSEPDYTCFLVLLSHARRELFTRELLGLHLQHLEHLEAAGQLLVAGPFEDGRGGMLVLRAASLEAARAIAASDPFVSSGAETCEVRQFTHACRENDFLRT
jgi:uncharacterized protein YciI